MHGSTNESSQDGSASDQIISDIDAPPCEQEALPGSNDAHQGKTKECTTLPSCFTIDDRSGQIDSLADTCSKEHNECKYSYFFYVKKRVLLFCEHFISSDQC
jgi:hypothetical protein